MRSIQFSKWEPRGTTTLSCPQDTPGNHAALAHRALLQQKLGGEQAGFVDTQNGSLIMAGGEFCVNATRCFGALLDLCARRQGIHFSPSSPRAYLVRVSGWPDSIPLRVTGSLPSWQVEATLRFRSLPVLQRESGKDLVEFPGIAHLLINTALHPAPGPSPEEGMRILRETGLASREAAGAVWWRKQGSGLSIDPIVYVRDADTLCAEQACGSATISLALLLFQQTGRSRMDIRQPSGDVLSVSIEEKPGGLYGVSVSGSVRLSAEGRFYTED